MSDTARIGSGMRHRARRIRQWLSTGLTPRITRNKRVRYVGWDVPRAALDARVNRDLNHPTKAVALDWLERDPSLPEKFSLLDVGCGPGALAAMIERHPRLKDRVSYTGIDQSDAALDRCRATYQGAFTFLKIDLQSETIQGHHDVVIVNEVIEHLPHYRDILAAALALKPRIFVLTTFAVIPGLRRDRLRWNEKGKAYMNSYAFDRLYEYLRARTRQMWVADLGTQEFARQWFPKKTLLVFYLRLAEQSVAWTDRGWAPVDS
jgi:2-polyprenyl-3-methyl-5-hydroxy-6-metoxy-1,4-benzoquinol methylase